MAEKPSLLLEGLVYPEAPRWHEGKLWLSDVVGKRVMTVDGDGRAEVVGELDDEPSGLGFLPDGTPLVVLMWSRRVVSLNGGRMELYRDLSDTGEEGDFLNDMIVDPQGRAYVDDIRRQSVFGRQPGDIEDKGDLVLRIDPDGSVTTAATGLVAPNGLALSEDGRTMVVAEARAYRLTSLSVGADGTLSQPRLIADTGTAFPDGICLDAEGATWMASPSGRLLQRVTAAGEITHVYPMGEKWAVACVLGGEDRKTLFVLTAVTSLEAIRVEGGSRGFVETVRVEVPGAGLP